MWFCNNIGNTDIHDAFIRFDLEEAPESELTEDFKQHQFVQVKLHHPVQ